MNLPKTAPECVISLQDVDKYFGDFHALKKSI